MRSAVFSIVRKALVPFRQAVRWTSGRLSRRPWLGVSVPRSVLAIPAFLTGEEKEYLVWVTQRRCEGWGAVVDLGAWLGGSSACLAEGLRRTGRTQKVQSFDLFRWSRRSMAAQSGVELPEGADFLPTFEGYVKEHRAWIEPRKEDLQSFRWNEGPIEILFVDAAKSWELLNAILAGFGDSIVPRRTRVIFQDFRFPLTHWLPLVVGSRPDLWQEAESVRDGTTVTFTTRRPLRGPDGIHDDYADGTFSLEVAERILRERMAKESRANRVLALRALYRKALIELPGDRALPFKQELMAAEGGVPEPGGLDDIEDVDWPVSRTPWLLYLRGEVAAARRLAQRCVSERGHVPSVLHLLGRICRESGELTLADEYLDRVIRSSVERCPYALVDRAAVRIRQGRLADAERDALLFLDRMRTDETAVGHAMEVLAEIWADDARPDRGLSVLLDLARDPRDSAVILACLACVEQSLGQTREAMEHFGRATALAPDHPSVDRCRAALGLGPR